MSKTTNKFAPQVRARAVLDHEADHPYRWAAVVSISDKIGCVSQTLFVLRGNPDSRFWIDNVYSDNPSGYILLFKPSWITMIVRKISDADKV